MKDVLTILDGPESSPPVGTAREELVARLDMYREAANARVQALREQLEVAEGFAAELRREIGRQRKLADQAR
jgi:hypothetical protein